MYKCLKKAIAAAIPTFESAMLLSKIPMLRVERSNPYFQAMHEIYFDHLAYANDLYSSAKENKENFNFNNMFKSLFMEKKKDKEEGAY